MALRRATNRALLFGSRAQSVAGRAQRPINIAPPEQRLVGGRNPGRQLRVGCALVDRTAITADGSDCAEIERRKCSPRSPSDLNALGSVRKRKLAARMISCRVLAHSFALGDERSHFRPRSLQSRARSEAQPTRSPPSGIGNRSIGRSPRRSFPARREARRRSPPLKLLLAHCDRCRRRRQGQQSKRNDSLQLPGRRENLGRKLNTKSRRKGSHLVATHCSGRQVCSRPPSTAQNLESQATLFCVCFATLEFVRTLESRD